MASIPTKVIQKLKADCDCTYYTTGEGRAHDGRAWELRRTLAEGYTLIHYGKVIYSEKNGLEEGWSNSDRDGINSLLCLIGASERARIRNGWMIIE
jgi:hypothetical protein